MKLTALDGGSVHSIFLAKSLAYNAHRIGLTEVVFFGNSAGNLAIFSEVVRYVFNTTHLDVQSGTTTDPVATLQDTNYIITALRVGGNESRIRGERIVLQHNTPGQGTTGADSFAIAMHSTPAILRYCRLIEEHATEDAILFSFTNPSGLVTKAIVKSGLKRRVYGACDAPSELIRGLPTILDCGERDLSMECYGLSYFSWLTHFTVRGEEATKRLITSPELYQETATRYFFPELARPCDNQSPNEHPYYYYHRRVMLKVIQEVGKARGEQTAHINQEVREALRAVGARTRSETVFIIWMQHYLRQENSYMQSESQQGEFYTREPLTLHQFIEELGIGDYVGVALDILEAVNSATTKRVMVPTRNHDTLDSLRPDDVIEISCDLSRGSLKPAVPMKVPTVQKNVISCAKEYERLVAAAILQQDKLLTVRALIAHPLINSYPLTEALAETYLDDE